MKVLFATAVIAIAAPASAMAGQYTLHPSGFGKKSYAAWKGKQGEADANGGGRHALYMQKKVLTPVNAAGVAIIDGFEGQTLEKLAFDVRDDGWCGAGAPRFNVTFTGLAGDYTLFYGCAAGQTSNAQEAGWTRRTFEGSFPSDPIAAISIIFDEGKDVGPGYTRLDDITVNQKTWTGPADNGN
jgi:hypothetical protein